MLKLKWSLAAMLALASYPVSAAVVGFEDFDGGAINLSSTANVFDFDAGGGAGGDVFGRVEPFVTGMPFDVADDSAADVSGDGTGSAFPADSLGIIGQNSTAIFALNDADGTAVNNAVWTFDISSATALTSISIDIGAMGDFEASSSDGFLIEAQIDGGGYATIFEATTDEAFDSFAYRAMDDGDVFSLNDPLQLFIDGAATAAGYLDKSDPTTGLMDTYTSNLVLGQSGSTLDIRLSWAGSPSGSEPQGIDNITVNGVVIPEPASALLGLVGLSLVGLRRRS